MANNLYDANIFTDFSVWIDGSGRIGQCPGFQPPDIQIATEAFRGGGMDGEVDIPMGIEKIDFEFDMHTWDTEIWEYLGYGQGSMNTPVIFLGSMMTPSAGRDQAEVQVAIETRALVKSIRTNKIEAGRKVEMTVQLNCNKYKHIVGGKVITEIDLFRKIVRLNGRDVTRSARSNIGLTY